VRQRQVADAEPGVVAQDRQAVVDHVPAFHPHQRHELPRLHAGAHVRRGRRERDFVRVPFGEAPDVVDHRERALDGFRAGDGTGHVDREERGVETAFARAWIVDMAGGGSAPAALTARLVHAEEIPAFAAEHLRRVDVRVNDDRLPVHARGARRRLRGEGDGDDQESG